MFSGGTVMKYRMSLVAGIVTVLSLHLAVSVAEAQYYNRMGRLQTVPQVIRGTVFQRGGVAGPGPGVIAGNYNQPVGVRSVTTSQLRFVAPADMTVTWDVTMPGAFDSSPMICPFSYNFGQGAIYRLRLSNIASREGKDYYPTIEVAQNMARSQAFLAHNSVPIEFTDNDFDQVDSGNYVTKVIYLPDPEFQGLAMAGVGTLVNTQLEPGTDPITEADNRGAILAIIRLGNKDLSVPGSIQPAAGLGTAGGVPSTQNYISGVTGPQYGVPQTQTNVGIPGPAYLPQGRGAGLAIPAVQQ
jgi:hypothetical protein